jgi:hypothetical protein
MDRPGLVLRRLLAALADQVEPGDGLPAIRARTAHNKTAAPGATRAAAKADYLRGQPAMAHTLQSETTPRGKQIRAAITLAHLLETDPLADLPDAPPVEWRIDAAGQIHGHVNDPWNEGRARAAMVAVAEFLGVPVAGSQGRNSTSEWVHLTVSATYRAVRVNVWTRVAIRTVHAHGGTR